MPEQTRFGTLFSLLLATCLGACSGLAPTSESTLKPETPETWLAPMPHNAQLSHLSRWWQQFNDPVLSELITAAQNVSPSVAQAAARIEQSRATQVSAQGARLPAINAQGNSSRARQDLNAPATTTSSLGLQTNWELDLFGGQQAAARAAQERFEGATASWHDARVSVAAEVANRYINFRACEALVHTTESDARSRAETARLTELSARAGFQAPANVALTRASSAQGAGQLTAQKSRCELDIKGLVALTAWHENHLRERLRSADATFTRNNLQVPQPAHIAVPQVPAQVLAQRPDVMAAEREWLARRFDVTQSQAARLPQISLSGHLSAARSSSQGITTDGRVWSLGPLTVTLPLFDSGTRRARVAAAEASLNEAAALYQATLRTAVREIEEALITLQSTSDREADAQTAATGYAESLQATQARLRSGLASLFELEDARRSAVQAQSALIDLQREHSLAWVALYRALGGGWKTEDTAAPAMSSHPPLLTPQAIATH